MSVCLYLFAWCPNMLHHKNSIRFRRTVWKITPRFRADNPGMSFLLADSLNMWFKSGLQEGEGVPDGSAWYYGGGSRQEYRQWKIYQIVKMHFNSMTWKIKLRIENCTAFLTLQFWHFFQKESLTSSGSTEKTPAHWSLLLFLELLWFSLSGLHGRNASRQPIYSNVIVFHVRAKQRFWSAQAGRCWQPIEWMEWRTWLTTGFRKTSTGPTRGTGAYRSWSWPISQEGPSYATSTTPGPLWSIHWSGKTTITVGNITFLGLKGFVCFCESNRAPKTCLSFQTFCQTESYWASLYLERVVVSNCLKVIRPLRPRAEISSAWEALLWSLLGSWLKQEKVL